ncbi:MAG: DUF1707 SHOCT-like domain-containing protein, partial [Thermoleophilaceae bacterium]
MARVLREGSVEGKLSIDTFSERIERTFAARSSNELDALAADLRPPGPLRRALMRGVAWWSA